MMDNVKSISDRCVTAFLVLFLLTSCAPSVPSSPTPSPTQAIYDVSTVTSSLEKFCGVRFKEEKKNGTISSIVGQDQLGLLRFNVVSDSHNLTQAQVTVSGLDNRSGWIGYDSYVHDCMLAMLQPLGLESLLIWYKEQLKLPAAETQVTNVQASTRTEGQNVRSLTISFGTSPGTSPTGRASSPGSPTGCGEGMITGLGGTRLNIRKNPGLDQDVVGKARKGDTVLLSCEEQEEDGIAWVKITAQGNQQDITGWVSKEYVTPK